MNAADYPQPALFIAGRWQDAAGRETMPVVNPATAQKIGDLPMATLADLDEALDAAARGFEIWRRASAYDRAVVLRRAAALLRERAADIARIITLEQGKVLGESLAEVQLCADVLEWYGEEARRAYGRIIPSKQPGVRHTVIKQPIGPAAAFSPWNVPLVIPARKIAAALAAGCSMVIKPAEETPNSCLALARALDDAGLPKGVLNLVFGDPATVSEYLIASPVIRKISFTGSTAVGKHLAGLAAAVMKPSTMELGGHAPVIVFDDADIDLAVQVSAAAKFRNAGQICIAPTRFYLHDDIHDRFVAQFTARAAQIQVGNGLEPGNSMGPLANARRVTAMQELTADAQRHGAGLAHGGAPVGNIGYFWQPTVLTDVPNAARIMNEEPFGPIAITQRFSDFDTVVAEANRLPFGLAAYAFTQSARRAADIGEAIEAGMVGINFAMLTGPETPFLGVKESGHGSEGGSEGLEAYLVTKYIGQG